MCLCYFNIVDSGDITGTITYSNGDCQMNHNCYFSSHVHTFIRPLHYQVIANNLWAILGRPVTIHHRKAVELLIQLHNLTPSPYLCENVIGSSMVSDSKVGNYLKEV